MRSPSSGDSGRPRRPLPSSLARFPLPEVAPRPVDAVTAGHLTDNIYATDSCVTVADGRRVAPLAATGFPCVPARPHQALEGEMYARLGRICFEHRRAVLASW